MRSRSGANPECVVHRGHVCVNANDFGRLWNARVALYRVMDLVPPRRFTASDVGVQTGANAYVSQYSMRICERHFIFSHHVCIYWCLGVRGVGVRARIWVLGVWT